MLRANNEAYESFSAACNLAVRLDAIAMCHKAYRHSERVARVANSSLPINDDQTAGAAGFFCQQDNRLVCRCVRISSAFQKFKSRFSHYEAHDRFAVAGTRNPAQLISVGSAAEQGRVAHSSRKFVEDSAGGGRHRDLPCTVQSNTADGPVLLFPAFPFRFDDEHVGRTFRKANLACE